MGCTGIAPKSMEQRYPYPSENQLTNVRQGIELISKAYQARPSRVERGSSKKSREKVELSRAEAEKNAQKSRDEANDEYSLICVKNNKEIRSATTSTIRLQFVFYGDEPRRVL
jgi:hypothetical protein